MSSSPTARLLLLARALLPGLLVGGQSVAAPAPDAPVRPAADSSLPTDPRGPSDSLVGRVMAEQVLAEVKERLRPTSHPQGKVSLDEGRDLTMLLRDLVMRQGDLSPEDQVVARDLNDRPSTREDSCSNPTKYPWGAAQRVCVHWDEGTTGDDARASYAKTVATTLTRIHNLYTGAGYRAPKSDAGLPNHGVDGRVDVYLRDLAPLGFFGYCAIDSQSPNPTTRYDRPAFCVLDNDYAASQYGTAHTPTEFLDVTAAHEYFHAVQFAYDAYEDRWLMEGTATWAEDYAYDAINDNRTYLRYSPLTRPRVSMDDAAALSGGLQYGDWIFFRYLSERYPDRTGILPTIIRRIWERADSTRGERYDAWSSQAVARVLRARGSDLRTAFSTFAAKNRYPQRSYEEGAEGGYPKAGPAGKTVMRPARLRASGTYRVNHLASVTHRFVSRRLKARTTRLRVHVDLPSRRIGVAALVTVYKRDGGITTRYVTINRSGDGTRAVRFSSRRVGFVELTMVNANISMRCWQNTYYSCSGQPRFQQQPMKWSVRVTR